METEKCENCQAILVQEEKGRNKKFCSHRCYDVWAYRTNERRRNKVQENARRYYQLHKDEPEFKKKQRIKFMTWLNKEGNREKFNAYMREKAKIWQKKKTKERQEQGVCTNCGKARDDAKFVWCNSCRGNRVKRECKK